MTSEDVTEAVAAVDTSVAVPLLVASHRQHRMVAQWAKGRILGLSGHALAETYSVLTRLPGDARVDPADAVALIDDNFAQSFPLSARGPHAPPIASSPDGALLAARPMTGLLRWRLVSAVQCWSRETRVPDRPTKHSG